ncbi:probable proline--tRNA ligase, mitochondrial [Helicoverpa armigera]|uniref:probable proline--tRNA ligase, mitochondrial n=1 Tax=Helicoverpa armigera TaxID=29058 RepID=UPI0030827AD1
MRYLSKVFQPVITIPKNAKIKNTEITCKSQKLLLECGLIRPSGPGMFTILPLARRALDKLEALIISSIETAGAQRMSVPSLTAASLWEKTGRLQEVGPELMRMEDRHGKKYLLAPTHEETIADLLSDVGPLSYKQLPLLLYQISNKYRDEHRPKHGLLRAREFSMLDAYGIHASEECARSCYGTVCEAYSELFRRLDLPVHKVSANPGEMGGSLSHEWQLPAAAGEDQLALCRQCERAPLSDTCDTCGGDVLTVSSVEVGHTFILGTKYSSPLAAHYTPASGAPQPLIMSCYGIGITRLLAASIEALSSETQLRWPAPIAPYSVIIIGPKEGSREWQSHGLESINRLCDRVSVTHDALIDDRHQLTIGKRLMMADRMGYPNIIVMGKASLENPPRYEVYSRNATAPRLLTDAELLAMLDGHSVQQNVISNKE